MKPIKYVVKVKVAKMYRIPWYVRLHLVSFEDWYNVKVKKGGYRA